MRRQIIKLLKACGWRTIAHRSLLLLALGCMLSVFEAYSAEITWTGSGSTSAWNDPANWSPNQVPGVSDKAILLGAGPVITESTTVGSVDMTYVTMTGDAPLHIAGTFESTYCYLYAPLVLDAASTGSMTNTLVGGSFVVQAGGTLYLTNQNTSAEFDGCSFTNRGTVVWANSDILAKNGTSIHNEGSWEIKGTNGVLLQQPSGDSCYFINTGLLSNRDLSSSLISGIVVAFTSTGQMDIWGGNDGASSGMWFSWYGKNVIHGRVRTFGESSDEIVVAEDGTFVVTTTFLGGNLTVESGGEVSLLSGEITGGVLIEPGGSLYLTNSEASVPGYPMLTFSGCAFTNRGTVHWRGMSLSGVKNTVISNEGLWLFSHATGAYELPFGSQDGNFDFINTGTLQETNVPAGGIVGFGGRFNSTGTLLIGSARLDANWVGTNVLHGTLIAYQDMNAILQVASNATLISHLSGISGIVDVQDGGSFLWTSGGLAGGILVREGGHMAFDLPDLFTKSIYGGWITNLGSVNCTATNSWNNGNVQPLLRAYYGATICNRGTWEWGANFSSWDTGHSVLQYGMPASRFINEGSMRIFGLLDLHFGLEFENKGLLEVRSAFFRKAGNPVEQFGGEIRLSGSGYLGGQFHSERPLDLKNGSLTGRGGVVCAVTNSAVVRTIHADGFPNGLVFKDGYVQTPAGLLSVTLAGETGSFGYDQIFVEDFCQLAGTLEVKFDGYYRPPTNAAYQVIQTYYGPQSGTFSTFNYPSNSAQMSVSYNLNSNPTNVTVTALGLVVESPSIVSKPRPDSSDMISTFFGTPGTTYTVEGADELSPPDWQKIVNVTAPATDLGLGIGMFELRVPTTNASQRFFRLTHPSY